MAEIILGIGTSHSPQISTPVEKWLEGNERYQEGGFELHSARDGARVSYEELLEMAPPGLEKEITPEKFEARHAENLANLAWLANRPICRFVSTRQHVLQKTYVCRDEATSNRRAAGRTLTTPWTPKSK